MGVASGSGWNLWVWLAGCGWNLWVWLVGVVVRRYIEFLILLIPTTLVSVLFCSSILLIKKNVFRSCIFGRRIILKQDILVLQSYLVPL